ncbi:hypothetical protein BJX76DRAFT_357983 [Aspergillus varians]
MGVYGVKCVLIGDHAVGKTSLLLTYTSKVFPSPRAPVLLDPFKVHITAAGKQHTLHLWDTTYEQGYTRMCPTWYAQTDVFLLCFSIASPNSFDDILEKWLPGVRHTRPQVPCVIVGTKVDLREDPGTKDELARVGMSPVGYKDGVRMAEAHGLWYVECSARTRENLDAVFDLAVTTGLQCSGTAKKHRCRIL